MTTKFRLLAEADTPTVVGKAWWNEALKLSVAGDQRRAMIGALGALAVVGVAIPVGVGIAASSDDDGDDTRTERRRALDLQRRQGWSFGVADEASYLTFADRSGPVDPAALAHLADDLAPRAPALLPMYVPTLFQAVGSRPAADAPRTEDAVAGFVALETVLAPIDTAAMRAARAAAGRLRVLLGAAASRDAASHDTAGLATAGLAVVVDLPGPEAVAFAGALADVFDPVFLFDNWPHPRGVVPAHLTLAAALTERARLLDGRARRTTTAPPLFVLDRARLAPYVDDENDFDNRWTARLPTADQLQAIGVSRVLYVVPDAAAPIDSDDLVDDLVAWAARGIDVRALRLGDVLAAGSDDAARALFAARDDRTTPAGGPAVTPAATPTAASTWRPAVRATAFSSPVATATPAHPVPAGFGQVPVVVDVATGALLGAHLYRRGSWHRTSSYFGGG